MATQSTTITVPTRHTINRRTLLKAAPAGAIALSVPAVAMPATTADRMAWEAAMQNLERIKAEDAVFTPIYNRIHAAWEAGRPSLDMIDWRALNTHSAADRSHFARSMDLDAHWRQFLDGEGKWWFAKNPEQKKAKYRAALDTVQAFRDAEARNDRDTGMAEADERYEAFGEAIADAESALMDIPAPDLEALRWKLDQLLEPNSEHSTAAWSRDYVAQTVADYHRLLGDA
jgi:hypothetical protein